MATGYKELPLLGGFDGTNPPAVEVVNNIVRLLFDAATDEIIYKKFKVPGDYASAPVLTGQFSMVSATSGSVVWACEVMCVTPGDAAAVDTESYDTVNTDTEAVPGTAGYLDLFSITLTNADSMAAGDWVTLKIYRDANNGSDDAAGDAELWNLEFQYTTS